MLIDGPIPAKVIEEMRVTFFPQFLGALSRALSPFGCPGVARDHRDVRRAFVNEEEALRIDQSQAFAPSTSSFFVSLGGTQRLFLKLQPSLCLIARLIVATDTLTPRCSSHISQ
jgi:hypothetical protein